MTHTGSTLRIFQCRTRGDFTRYARASKTTQLRSHPRFPNRLAILNEDRILSGGCNEAFRRNSIKLLDCRAFRLCKTVRVSHIGSTRDFFELSSSRQNRARESQAPNLKFFSVELAAISLGMPEQAKLLSCKATLVFLIAWQFLTKIGYFQEVATRHFVEIL